MKQSRFLGIFLAGFMVLSFSYSSDLMAMAAFDDAFSVVKDADTGLSSVVDADGNVLQDVTEEQLADLRAAFADSEGATLKELSTSVDGMQGKLLSADNPLALQFVARNEAEISVLSQEARENLVKRVSGLKTSGLAEFKGLDVTRDMNNAAQEAVQTATQKLADNVDEVVSDFKKTGKEFTNAKNLASKYIKKFKNLSSDTIKDINDAVNSGDRQAVEEALLKAAKEDAVSGLSKIGEGVSASVTKVLKDAIQNIEKRFTTLTSDMDALAADTKGTLTAAFKSGLDDDLQSANIAFDKNESLIQGQQTSLLNKLKVLPKNWGEDFSKDLSIKRKEFSSDIASSPRFQGMADSFSDLSSKIGDGLKGLPGKAYELGKSMIMTLGMAVLFMIPNIVQSTFLAHKMIEVELQTLAAPIQYGPWVFQIPISCFNFDNPSATIPIYVRIPVATIGQTVSPAASLNNVVSGPASDNAISRAIGPNVSRYHINEAQYYTYNPGIIVAYFNSYQDWGSVPLTSSQFTSGQVIDLTTGIIIDDSGERISATGIEGFHAYPLIAPLDWHPAAPSPALSPEDVRKALPQMLSKLNLAGDVVKYIDYVSVGSGATGSKNSASLQSLFDCSCMDTSSTTPCSTGTTLPNAGVCMISRMLNQYAGGLSFNADGTVGSESAGTAGQGAAATNTNLLGSVMPLYGWGGATGLARLINQTNFPSFTVAAGTNPVADATKNYSALGCWVYLSADTPFAQAVAQNNVQNSVTGPYVDYIIFLDAELNQVPLMVPIEKPHYVAGTTTVDYTTTGLGLNPKVTYWTSIAAFDNSTGKALNLPGCADPTSGLPIKYDLQGNPVPATGGDSNLAGVAAQNTAPGTCVISSAIADLSNNFYKESLDLSGQFSVHQQAMVNKLNNGPFNYGNVSLTQSPYNITVPGASASAPAQAVITLYEGSTCYGSSVPDLLVAWDSSQPGGGATATLPDKNATEFYSLITDIIYSVASDGSLVPSSFSNAPLTASTTTPETYSIVSANLSTFFFMEGFESSLETGFPPAPATPYVQLCNGETCSSTQMSLSAYVTQQRDAWATAFDVSGQAQGITIGNLTFSMPSLFDTTTAIANGAFIYNVTPSPTATFCQNDLFIIIKTPTPGLGDLANPINAVIVNPATTTHYVLSLVTGFVYDMQGTQLPGSGLPRRISIPAASLTALDVAKGDAPAPATVTSTIYNKIIDNIDFALGETAPGFDVIYHGYVTQYQAQMQRPMGPYTFGDFSLGILTEDDVIGNFVYFTASGMHDMATFEPTDFLITYSSESSNPGPLTSSTTQMMSIISGNLYDNTDSTPQGTLTPTQIISATATLQPTWSSWLTKKVAKLQAEMVAQIAATTAEQTKLDNLEASIIAQPTSNLSSASAAEIISQLVPGGTQGLPAPYGLLQYYPSPSLKEFVHVSPASKDEDTSIYLFFNVGPDKVTVAHPTPPPLGAVYTAAGTLQTIVKGVTLQVIKDQYGVVVNSDGTQRLALPLLQPSFIMKDPTETFTFGSDSSNGDLISSTSSTFPGGPVVMPKGYYLYYSMTMQAYYVWDSKRSRWISVVSDNQGRGHVYAQDGSPIKWAGKVAFSTSSSASADGIAAADDMILLYENQSGNMQGYMSNGKNYLNLGQTGSPMTWTPLKGNTALNVTVNSNGTKYTIDGTVYKVNKAETASKWYALDCVPSQEDIFDSNGNVRTAPIKVAYQKAQLVMNDSGPTYLLFNGVMYKVSTSSGTSGYTMEPVKPVDPAKPATVTLTLGGKDPDTGAPFVTVTDTSNNTYTYIYLLDSIPASQFTALSTMFAGTTATATRAFAVGSAADAAMTNVLFAQNIPKNSSGLALTPLTATTKVLNVPAKNSAAYTGFDATTFYINLEKLYQSTDGRYFAQLQPWSDTPQNNVLSFASAANGAYVDLHTGILYDTTHGRSLGYSLGLDDLLTVLNYYQVSMAYGVIPPATTSTLNLVYRTPATINAEAQLFANRVNATT